MRYDKCDMKNQQQRQDLEDMPDAVLLEMLLRTASSWEEIMDRVADSRTAFAAEGFRIDASFEFDTLRELRNEITLRMQRGPR